MKVKFLGSNTFPELTIGKWYDIKGTPSVDGTPYYHIKDDNGKIRFIASYLFITVEEERNNILNRILDES